MTVDEKLDRILSILGGLQKTDNRLAKEIHMASKDVLGEIAALQSELANNTSAVQSAETLIGNLVSQGQAAIDSAASDAEALASLKDLFAHFQANDTALAAAVVAGTPSAATPAQPLPPVVAPPTVAPATEPSPPPNP